MALCAVRVLVRAWLVEMLPVRGARSEEDEGPTGSSSSSRVAKGEEEGGVSGEVEGWLGGEGRGLCLTVVGIYEVVVFEHWGVVVVGVVVVP